MKSHVAIILNRHGKLLFIQRAATKKTLPNIWAFPSGTVEEGEKWEDTAVREAKEELGVVAGARNILGAMELPEFNVRLHFVVCNIESGEPSIQEPGEIQAIRWMTMKEFFEEYRDNQIGHGLVYLRAHPEMWSVLI